MGLLDHVEFRNGLLSARRETVPAAWCALHEVPAELPHTISLTDPALSATYGTRRGTRRLPGRQLR